MYELHDRVCDGMCLHIYICCEVIVWAKFGLLNGYYLGQVRVIIIWAKVIWGQSL